MQITFHTMIVIILAVYGMLTFVYSFVYYNNYQQPNSMFPYSKRAAILQNLAKTNAFSSATSLGAASLEGNHKRTVQLHETVWGIGLTPSKFNGTWISDSDIMFKDQDGGISVLNLDTNTSYKVLNIPIKIRRCK